MGMKKLDWIAVALLVAGGLNWGLVTWLNFDLVTFLSFGFGIVETIIKSLVGAAGIYGLWFLIKSIGN